MPPIGSLADEPRPHGARMLLLAAVLVLAMAGQAHAYIGPGAGFALAGSFFAVFAAVGSALLTFITWPVRLLRRTLFGWRALRKARFKRVVILGLDGMDHGLTETMLDEGKLPHLAGLRDRGCFKPLGTTVPPLSPVAWSTFQTGVNPGKHNIFDFLTPGPAHLPRQAQLRRDPPAPPVDPPGQVPDPPGQGRPAAAPQEPAVLEHPGQVRHLQLRPARADHLAAREAPGRAAVGHVRPRPARHPGDVLVLHDPQARARARRSAARSTTSTASATSSAPSWSARRTRSAPTGATSGCRSR